MTKRRRIRAAGFRAPIVILALAAACTLDTTGAPAEPDGTAIEAPRPATAPAIPAAVTATPTGTVAIPPTATATPTFTVAHTDGDGVAVRDACDDGARVSAPGQGIAEGAVVVQLAVGEGDCAGWMQVRDPEDRESWVRTRYLAATSPPVPSDPSSSPRSAEERREHPVVVTTNGGSEVHLETTGQADILLYYLSFAAYLNPSNHNLGAWRQAAGLYQNEQVSGVDFYRYTRSAYEAHHSLARRWTGEGPPAPEGLIDVLPEVSSIARGVLEKRGDAMGHAALAIAGDIEELDRGEELLRQAEAGVVAVVAAVSIAANRAGLNMEALRHMVDCVEEAQLCGLRPPPAEVPVLLSDCPNGAGSSQADASILVCRGSPG